MSSIQQLNDRIKREAGFIQDILTETNRIIVGQERLVNRLL